MAQKPFTSVQDIFECWDTLAEMAIDVGQTHWTVQKWNQRESIPSGSWGDLIDALQRKGKNLSVEQLLSMHGARLPRRLHAAARAER